MTNETRIFKKSSFSPLSWQKPGCVYVSIAKKDVLIRRTDNPDILLQFTRDEWTAFVNGVKNGEFDTETQ